MVVTLTSLAVCAYQVAILCNHQRSVPKGHVGQMEKLQEKTLTLQTELHELQAELAAAKRGKTTPGKKSADTCAPPHTPVHARPAPGVVMPALAPGSTGTCTTAFRQDALAVSVQGDRHCRS